MRKRSVILLAIIFSCLPSSHLFSQDDEINSDTLRENAPKVFLDCRGCDEDYIKTEINFVNYVRDRKEAEVHILITTESTGGGGTEYTIEFIGQDQFEKIDDTLKYFSKGIDTWEEIREGLVNTLKIGLMRYVARTPLSDHISISFDEEVGPTDVEDKWNFWVFTVYLDAYLSGEKSYNTSQFYGYFSADRVTPEWKIHARITGSVDEDEYEIGEETISSTKRFKSFRSRIVKSINDHWSAGGSLSVYSSTYSNTDLSTNLSPGIEYNYFPYSESTKRQLRFLYRFGYESVRYREETIYDETSEDLFNQSLEIQLELIQKWGKAGTSLTASHYFHDTQKYHVTLYSYLSYRLFKGFSLYLNGYYSRIHDRLSIPKGEAGLEEILLRRRLLETDYSYGFSVGFSYTFGSVYSNVVNPRFGW